MDADISKLPYVPSQPETQVEAGETPVPSPFEMTPEMQAQLAEMQRQAIEALAKLVESLRQSQGQLGGSPGETEHGPPVTGGLDPLPAGEDDATGVAIPIPETLPVFVAVPGDKVLPPDGVGLARAAVMPVESVAVGATELAVAAEQAVAAAQDDLVPVASPAAVTTWAQEPTAAPASAAASVVSDSDGTLAWAPMTHEFRVGAEGHAA